MVRAAAVALALVVGCQSSADDYPINVGGTIGPGAGSGGTPQDANVDSVQDGALPDGGAGDAGIDDAGIADGGVAINGRVCLISDLRALGACAATGAGNLQVTLGGASATTAADGRFSITAASGAGQTWRVKSSRSFGVVTSVMPFGAGTTIPVLGVETYNDLLNSNGVLMSDQQGSVVARLIRGSGAASGVSATSNPVAANATAFYDNNNSASDWGGVKTGAAGVVWLPGLPLAPSPVLITLTPDSGANTTTTAVVEDQSITFVTKQLP